MVSRCQHIIYSGPSKLRVDHRTGAATKDGCADGQQIAYSYNVVRFATTGLQANRGGTSERLGEKVGKTHRQMYVLSLSTLVLQAVTPTHISETASTRPRLSPLSATIDSENLVSTCTPVLSPRPPALPTLRQSQHSHQTLRPAWDPRRPDQCDIVLSWVIMPHLIGMRDPHRDCSP
ncbi:hypothetical protein EVG20_g196 [Dentipellis fragilis]|uniref:Uncharacterized protein n=1 Tax=Dentipellis fragilis TaxID=205917 RepID=A0A4Y9ZG95_9AGAM|nr:hypothetical protein EVG20_g196 [Dentipellis fragilis]